MENVVALKEEHRSSIYRALAPMLGEEATEAMLAHFPARDVEEPVTKADLALTKTDLCTEIQAVRTEIEAVRTDIERSTKRTIAWLSGVIIAVGSLMVSAGGVLVANLR